MSELHIIERKNNGPLGTIELPKAEDFTGLMWLAYEGEAERRGLIEQDDSVYRKRQKSAYTAAGFISKHGQWKLEGLTLEEFQQWESDPTKERVKFVCWLSNQWGAYISGVLDPNDRAAS